MTSRWQEEKSAVVKAAHQLAERGLVSGAGGNISVRLTPDGSRDLMAISASGRKCADLSVEDVVVVDFDLDPVEGSLTPSSESLIHIGIYKVRPDVNAAMHTHPVYASVAAVSGLQIPPIIDEMVVFIGGAVHVCDYAFPGTQELADSVVAALGERNAALIRNHGAVGVGKNLDEALDICALTERMAQVFVYSSLLKRVDTLPPDVVEAETSIFRMRQGTVSNAAAGDQTLEEV
jgi:L-fuculose-phosphate aldolase